MNKYKFSYGYHSTMTVTVEAHYYDDAVYRARLTLDRRYHKANREPPVGWTLEMLEFTHHTKRIKKK